MPNRFPGLFARGVCAAVLWLGVSTSGIGAATITGPAAPLSPGQSFVATVSLDSFAGIEAVDVGFDFDDVLLSLEAVELAPGVPEPFLPLLFEPGKGQKRAGFIYLSALPAGSGSGAMLLATFKALGATPAAGTPISFTVMVNEIPESVSAPLTVIAVVPEPASTVLIVAGLALLAGISRRRSRYAED